MPYKKNIALFGEAERGMIARGELCLSLDQLKHTFGEPPPESKGLHFGVQALLYGYRVIFFRVSEEGYSLPDYFQGLHLLGEQTSSRPITALCVPGVGDEEILRESTEICKMNKSVLITTEADLYDYLTSL